ETNLQDAARKAAEVLARGGIVVYPTDTVYGLGVDAENHEALERLKELKGRDKKRPISVIVSSVEEIEQYATLTDEAKALAEKFLPGPLTLVLTAKDTLAETIGLNGAIGVRIPNNAFCQALAKAFGKPYTTTSANLTGLPPLSSVDKLMWEFGP